ncbi:RNA-binding S4 domain-containing protein [Frigoribacterium sp. CG_9.8]|uniref:RNA-binding S4 domain-containing protein n=1 Tax=Frigoribacterium sp. CG_9.8 TaxID=2787733 RepID=UPI0018C96943|nr:RNA-binding S4 domain-containing protein [Frigoribacterium sp. CG_9.8]MBG6107840.1 ribosome-associated heat shock protein Hsp15 [Frigoribacterium sp. CG_9.8]
MDAATSTRVDSWIWAVRLAKTRSAATAACRAGHVQVNGERAKAAQPVRIGDEVRLRTTDLERTVQVARLVAKRVGASVAVDCLVDLTPPPPPKEEVAVTVLRDRGAGRPTKRERRDLEKLRGRSVDG